MSRKWNLDDFLRQIEAIKAMGPLEQVVKNLPGFSSILEDFDFSEETLDSIESMLRAMSREERLDPQLLAGPEGLAARQRVAQDSGSSLEEVETLIEHFQAINDVLGRLGDNPAEAELLEAAEALLPERDAVLFPDSNGGDDDEPVGSFAEDAEAAAEAARLAFDHQVDDVLRKLHLLGIGALDPEERRLLDEASARYRGEKQRV